MEQLRVREPVEGWTERQRQVLDLIVKGKSNSEIADQLGLSIDGVKWHMREILSKLNVESRTEAAEYWRKRNGLPSRFARAVRGLWALPWAKAGVAATGVVLVGAAAVLVLAVLRDGNDDDPAAGDQTPAPTVSATTSPGPSATPGPCPVDQAICDFAVELENRARDESLRQWAPVVSAEMADRALNMWGATGGKPRVTTIGCPDQGAMDCSTEFAVALSSLPVGLEEQDGRGLEVFFFARDVGGQPQARTMFEPPDGRKTFVDGGQATLCDPAIVPTGGCVDYTFGTFRTGAEVTEPVVPGDLPPLRQVAGATSYEITEGEPYRIQTGELWYFNYLCDACGPGPFPNLYRAYRASDGQLVIDDLRPRAAGLGSVAAFTADWQQGLAYLVTCTEGNCYSLESGTADSDAPAQVWKSVDGGITWQADGAVPSLTSFGGIVAGEVLATSFEAGFDEPRFWFYPSGRELEVPQGVPANARPFVLNSLTIAWIAVSITGNEYYDGAGTRLFGPVFGHSVQVAVADPQYQHTFLQWDERPGTPTSWIQTPYYSYVGRVDHDGKFREIYGLPGDTMWISGEFRRSGDAPPALFGRFRFGASVDYVRDVSFGAVLDLRTATLHRFAELDANRPDGSFVWMQDLVQSPPPDAGAAPTGFLRITNAETCLNIREQPGTSARVLTCLADDVLVADMGQRSSADGIEWLLVRTPGHSVGWASAEFLR